MSLLLLFREKMSLRLINVIPRYLQNTGHSKQICPGILILRGLKVENFDEEKYKKKKHPETPMYPEEYSLERPKGKIFDKKPFRISLIEGKRYHWCTCGTSKNQPMCDGSHKKLKGTYLKKTAPKFAPLAFKVEEAKEYWLCNCKQTGNAPFCDGTHKREDIQSAIRN